MAYVYQHIREDKNHIFYIGIGSDNGGKYIRANSKARKNSKIWNLISKKTSFRVEIVLDNISWKDACKKETELILKYGRIDISTGILANMTNGGEGVLGLVQSKESIEASVSKRRGRIQSEDEKLRRSISGMGRIISDETRKKMSISRKMVADRKGRKEPKKKIGRQRSLETRKKISIGNKGKPKPWLRGKKPSSASIEKMKSSCKIKKPVIQFSMDGKIIMEYDSQKSAALNIGTKKEAIGRACRGIIKSHKGYIWKHK